MDMDTFHPNPAATCRCELEGGKKREKSNFFEKKIAPGGRIAHNRVTYRVVGYDLSFWRSLACRIGYCALIAQNIAYGTGRHSVMQSYIRLFVGRTPI